MIKRRNERVTDPTTDAALRILLSLLYNAANQWNNAYIDREKVDAALRKAGVVDASGELTEFGQRYVARRDAEAAARAGG